MANLSEVVREKIGPQVLAAHPGTAGDAHRWRMKYLPNFPVASSSPRALRQYYRSLPVTFLLHEGLVQEVWWNRIPTAAEVAQACPAPE